MIIFHILVEWNKNSECCGKAHFGGNEVENLMVKVRNLSDIQQEISFTELDFCQRHEESFKTSELGRIKSLLLLMEMSVSFALIGDNPTSLRTERGRKAFFTPKGKMRVIARETDRSAREEAMRCSMLLRKRQQDFLQGERYRDLVHSERSCRHERVKKCGQESSCQCKSHSVERLIRHSEGALRTAKDGGETKIDRDNAALLRYPYS